MRVLVLGSSGMLGQALMAEGQRRGLEMIGASIRNTSIKDLLDRTNPAVVINTVAITDTALCESDPGAAYVVNARPAALLAEEWERRRFYLIQISSDQCQGPIHNEYARTKKVGEKFALQAEAMIVRTNIVGFRGYGKPTFLEWAMDVIENDKPATLYVDHITSGIDVWHFSEVLFDLLPFRRVGVVNIASRDHYTKEIFIRALAARMQRKLTHATLGIGEYFKDYRLSVGLVESLLGRPLPTMSDVIDRILKERQKRCLT